MYKKILFLLFFVSLLFIPQQNVFAQDSSQTNIYFFWGQGCPHCAKAEPFLKKLDQQYSDVTLYDFEVYYNRTNQKLLQEVGRTLGINISGVPAIIIGDQAIIGFSETITPSEIERRVEMCQQLGCPDEIGKILGIEKKEPIVEPVTENIKSIKIQVPFLHEIETKDFSLPVLTIILGVLDGFNPCAMWVLLFLISLLLGMKDKKRMWILGSAFIIASALVYFIFMAAWLNLIIFLGFIVWIRVLIGLIALAGGGYNLKEYFTNPEGACKVTNTEKRQKVFTKLKDITQQKSFYLALGGIILLAFAVNLVELVCSAGLPAVYTQVLALNDLAKWQYYLYISLYILVFMFDDLLVFFVAMTTLQITGLTTKYTRYSHLIGGILMVIIGLLLIFKPEALMFG